MIKVFRVYSCAHCAAKEISAQYNNSRVKRNVVSQGSQKTFFMDKPPAFENGKPKKNLFYKISSYQGFTSKPTLILVSPLSFKNSNP